MCTRRTSNAASPAKRSTKSVPLSPSHYLLLLPANSRSAQLLELKKELASLRAEVASLRNDEQKRKEEEEKAKEAGKAAREERETDLE